VERPARKSGSFVEKENRPSASVRPVTRAISAAATSNVENLTVTSAFETGLRTGRPAVTFPWTVSPGA